MTPKMMYDVEPVEYPSIGGMKVIMECHPWRRNAAAGILVHTGSRDEPSGMDGVSHFLEHLCFKGTMNRSAGAINLQFDEMGANANAYTTEEATCFYAYAPSESVLECVTILFDIMTPGLRPEDVELERRVVLDEIAMQNDIPQSLVFDEALHALYSGQPLGRRVLGASDAVGRMTCDEIREYQRRRYAASNMSFIAVGQLDADKILAQIQACSSRLEKGAGRRDKQAHFSKMGKSFIVRNDKTEYLRVAMPAPEFSSPLRAAGEALELLLGDEYGSVFFNSIVRKGLAEMASAEYVPFSDAGAMFLSAETDASSVRAVKRLMIDGYRSAMDAVASGAAMEGVRNKLMMGACHYAETPMGRFEELVRSDIGGCKPLSSGMELERYKALRSDEIKDYFSIFPPNGDDFAVAGVGPLPDL
jgi:predicted Zn-dependent peptidase